MISFFSARTLVLPALCLAAIQASQDATPLPLKHGVYIQKAFACKGAPNAAIRVWDGVGFSGAHSSQCKSRVVSHKGSSFQMSTTCAARGDGSPESSTVADEFSLSAMSKTGFVMSRRDEPGVAYRWCSAGSVD
jgi:hypothetical protein